MARGGDESEVVLSATFMFYQLVPAKEKMSGSRLGLSRVYSSTYIQPQSQK